MRKNKKILSALIVFCLSVLLLPYADNLGLDFSIKANAAKAGNFIYTVSGNEVTIVEVEDSVSGNVVIPDRIGIFKVTKIDENAFSGCMNVGRITLGRYIKDFYSNSFSDCSVTDFAVNENNSILCSGSDGCIYNKNKTILFAYPCKNSRTTFTVPDGTTRVFDRAFFSAVNLKEITVPETVTKIGQQAFAFCYDLERIELSEKITSVSDRMFVGCTNLKKIKLPKNAEKIGSFAFAYCTRLSDIAINKKLKTISEGAFYYCTSINELTVPGSVEKVGDKAFFGCLSLEKAKVYSDVAEFNGSCFLMKDRSFKKGFDSKKFADYADAYISCSMFKDESAIEQAERELCKALDLYEGFKPDGIIYCNEDSAAEAYSEKTGIRYKYHHHNNHIFDIKTTAATTKKDGKISKSCSMCDYSETETVPKIKSIKLSKTTYVYDGKKKTPSVTVKDTSGKTLKKDVDYTVKYSGTRKAVGTYTVKITFKGNYSGSKSLEFSIVLGQVKNLKTEKNGKNTVVKWDSVKGAKGYIVYKYDSSKKEYVKLSTVTKSSLILKNFKGTAKLKVRAYCVRDGKTITGKISSVKKVVA